jgi:hypothetical protein
MDKQSGKSIKSIKPKRYRLTEARLAANRANAKKAGRPPGAMNTEKIALRDRIRLREKEIVDHMFYLAFHGESEAVQLGALHGLFDRGWGRPVQPHDGDGQGGPITFSIITGVPEPSDDLLPWEPEVSIDKPKPDVRPSPVTIRPEDRPEQSPSPPQTLQWHGGVAKRFQ